MIAILVRIVHCIFRSGLRPLINQHRAVSADIILVIHPGIRQHVAVLIQIEPLSAVFSPLAGHHLIIFVIIVPNPSVIFLPTSGERSHGSTHREQSRRG